MSLLPSLRTIAHCMGVAAALVLAAPVAAQPAGGFEIAITVDDLPAHGKLPPGMTRLGIATSHLATFKAHGVPQVWGFVNGLRIAEEPDSAAVLDAWRQAGYPLGNHTYSHLNLGRAASLPAWQADVDAGEAAIAARMQGEDWHVLRLPNLSAGTDPARSAAAFAYLRTRGYRLADVSVAFSDWDYTDAYARCLAQGDTATIAQMRQRYLQGVDDALAHMQAVSLRVHGRIIPQVLLTHLGGWSAVMLPEVMARLDAAGARYITLEQAQADPAYAQPGGGSVMQRTARRDGISLAGIAAAVPSSDVKQLCR